MNPSGSYPSDDATRIITGCAEVIFELESADHHPVQADLLPTNGHPDNNNRQTERVCSQSPPSPRRTKRGGLKAWIQRAATKRGW